MLGPVAGRVDHADDDVADGDLVSVGERLVRVVGVRRVVDRDQHAVLEREPSMPRDVIGMRVRLEHADDPHVVPLRSVQVLLDPERGVVIADAARMFAGVSL